MPVPDGFSIFQVLPRGMRFEKESATSVDLCVAEIVKHSAFAERTMVFADFKRAPLLANARSFASRSISRRVAEVVAAVRRENPAVVIVQQHLPTASRIAAAVPETPVFLQVHNFQKRSKAKLGLVRRCSDWLRERRYGSLAGLMFVSEAAMKSFDREFGMEIPRIVLPNGFVPADWVSSTERSLEILCTGRLAPEKGIIEAGEAVVEVLRARPDWRATFILSEIETHPQYAERCFRILASLPAQTKILTDISHRIVREANSRAAIALVPSKWREPFGRTALEAHAGGAALISSGTGGLSEISGDAALYLKEITPNAIRAALLTLIDDPAERERLGQAGMRRINSRFTIDLVSSRMDEFVSEIALSKYAHFDKK